MSVWKVDGRLITVALRNTKLPTRLPQGQREILLNCFWLYAFRLSDSEESRRIAASTCKARSRANSLCCVRFRFRRLGEFPPCRCFLRTVCFFIRAASGLSICISSNRIPSESSPKGTRLASGTKTAWSLARLPWTNCQARDDLSGLWIQNRNDVQPDLFLDQLLGILPIELDQLPEARLISSPR